MKSQLPVFIRCSSRKFPFAGYVSSLKWILATILLLISGFFQPALSGEIDKAFKALEVKNYFASKHSFLKSARKYPCVSNFGLSVISSRNDNPYHDLDSSYLFIRESLRNLLVAADKELKLLAKYNVNESVILEQKKSIESMAFKKAVAANDTSAFNHFISGYEDSEFIGVATRMRDSVLFDSLSRYGDAVALRTFLDAFPDSHLFSEASILYEKVLYREMTAGGSLEEYEAFLLMYPSSPYRRDAEQMVYELFIGDQTVVKRYHEFVKKYPESPYSGKAWSRIYDLYMSDYSQNAIDSFRTRFPDYPYQERLKEDLKLSNTQLFPVSRNGKFGFIDYFGELVVDFRYESVGEFTEGLSLVYRDGKAGFISKSGDEVVPPFYDEAEPFRNNVAIVTEGGISGVIDRNGKMLVPLSFDEISDYEEGLASASQNGVFGFIDKAGKQVLPFEYEAAGGFYNGTAVCMKDGKYGIIDRYGNVLVPFSYDAAENFRNDISRLMSDSHWGLVNRDSRIVVSAIYDEIGLFTGNRALAVKGNRSGYLNSDGRSVISFIYDAPADVLEKSEFRNNMAVVRYKGKYGVIDTLGRKLLPYRFEDVIPVDSAVFIVKVSGNYGVTDRSGITVVIPFRYQSLEHNRFNNYIAVLKNKTGVLDRKGKVVIGFKYEDLVQVTDTVFISKQNGKYGLTGKSGTSIVSAEYSKIVSYQERFLMMYRGEEYDWFDLLDSRFFWKNNSNEEINSNDIQQN